MADKRLLETQCPHCGGYVNYSADLAGSLIECPHCSQQFEAPIQAHPPEETDPDRSEELDGMRIKKMATLKRSLIRSHTYWLIGFLAGVVMGGLLLFRAFVSLDGITWWQFRWIFLLPMPLVVWWCRRAWRKAQEAQRLSLESDLDTPSTPPDFSTLGNGSHRMADLSSLAGSPPPEDEDDDDDLE